MKNLATLLLVCTSWCIPVLAQNHYYYLGSGDLHQPWNWNTSPDGSGNTPSGFTGASDTFELAQTHDIALTATWSLNGIGTKLIIGNGSDSLNLTVPSNFSLNTNVLVRQAASLILKNTILPSFDSLYSGSTVEYGANGNQALSNKVYDNLIISGSGSKTTTGNLTVNHTLTIHGTLDINSTTESLVGDSMEVEGNGTLRSIAVNSFPSSINWPCHIEFYRNGTQNIPSGHYINLSISGSSGTKTLVNGDLTIDSNLLIQTGSTLAVTTFALKGNLVSIIGGGNITTTNISATPIPAARTWKVSITYSAANAGQTIMQGNYQALSITSGTNTNVASGDIIINDSGTFQVSSGNTLDMQSFRLQFGYGIAVGGAGIIKTQNTSNTPLPNSQIWTQSITYNASGMQTIVSGEYKSNLNINGGSRIFPNNTLILLGGNFSASLSSLYQFNNWELHLNGNSAQTLTLPNGYLFQNLHFSGSGLKTCSASFTVTGQLTIEQGATFNLGNNLLSGAFTTFGSVGGLLRVQQATAIPSGKSWNFCVQFEGADGEIPAGEYLAGLRSNSSFRALQADVLIKDTFTIANACKLKIGPHHLQLNGIINNLQNGQLVGGVESRLTVGPSSSTAGFIYFSQEHDTCHTLHQLTVNRSGNALILGNDLRIVDCLTLFEGNLNANGSLIFTSTDENKSAQLMPLGQNAMLTGLVRVEKFVKGRSIHQASRWHFLASPINTSNYFSNNWQKQIHITGTGTGGNLCPNLTAHSNGLDASGNNKSSCYSWNEITQHWDSIYASNAQNLEAGKGYRIFVRGTRQQGCGLLTDNGADPEDVVLSATGILQTGSINITCSPDSGGYTLIGNPYQATIDLMSEGIQFNNLSPKIYTFRNDLSATGTYASYTMGATPDSQSMSRFIYPGEAFFVQSAAYGNANLTINESAIAAKSSTPFYQLITESPHLDVRHGLTEKPKPSSELLFDPQIKILQVRLGYPQQQVIIRNITGAITGVYAADDNNCINLSHLNPGIYFAETEKSALKLLIQ